MENEEEHEEEEKKEEEKEKKKRTGGEEEEDKTNGVGGPQGIKTSQVREGADFLISSYL